MKHSPVKLIDCFEAKSSAIRQKIEYQNGCYKKTKHAKFSEEQACLTPPDTHTHVCVLGGKKCSFFRKFGVFCCSCKTRFCRRNGSML